MSHLIYHMDDWYSLDKHLADLYPDVQTEPIRTDREFEASGF